MADNEWQDSKTSREVTRQYLRADNLWPTVKRKRNATCDNQLLNPLLDSANSHCPSESKASIPVSLIISILTSAWQPEIHTLGIWPYLSWSCQLQIGTCHLPPQGLDHVLMQWLVCNNTWKKFRVESRNDGLCAQGKTGRTGLHTVRYFQEATVWAQFLYLFISVLSCSVILLFATPRIIARQASLSIPGKNTGAGCHLLLQGIFLTQGSNPHLLCLLHW